jgi:hypothetical protein
MQKRMYAAGRNSHSNTLMIFGSILQRSYDAYLKAKDASYLFDEPTPYTVSKTNINVEANSMTPRKPSYGYKDSSRGEGKHTLSGRVNALSAQLEDSDVEEGFEEKLVRYAHDLELDQQNNSTGGNSEAGRTWSKLSAEELELEQQSSVSIIMNSQFQKPKQQDKNTPNGCFHLLFKGECTREEKCTYSHDPLVMVQAVTPKGAY